MSNLVADPTLWMEPVIIIMLKRQYLGYLSVLTEVFLPLASIWPPIASSTKATLKALNFREYKISEITQIYTREITMISFLQKYQRIFFALTDTTI